MRIASIMHSHLPMEHLTSYLSTLLAARISLLVLTWYCYWRAASMSDGFDPNFTLHLYASRLQLFDRLEKEIDIIIIQLIFLQQYFPIPVPCNITRYCTGVIARALGLRGILATTMCFN